MNEISVRRDCIATLTELVCQANELRGRVRLQKTAYLLQRSKLAELENVSFRYSDYGPSSQEISASLVDALSSQAILETQAQSEDTDDDTWVYKPGNAASSYSDLLSNTSREQLKRVIEVTKKTHWRALELATSIDFLRREGLDSHEAEERALAQKPPAYKSFREQANELLRHLEMHSAAE